MTAVTPGDLLACSCGHTDTARQFVDGPFWGGDPLRCPACHAPAEKIQKLNQSTEPTT